MIYLFLQILSLRNAAGAKMTDVSDIPFLKQNLEIDGKGSFYETNKLKTMNLVGRQKGQ